MAGRTDVLWVTAQFALFAAIVAAALTSAGSAPAAWLVVGIASVVAGLVLSLAAMTRLGPRVSPFPTPQEGSRLVTTGVYRLVRHPIYGGVILVAVGAALASWSLPAVVLAVALVPFFVAKSTHEERLLTARFPDYAAYREVTTKRLLPWVI